MNIPESAPVAFSYLGPAGTFTEQALRKEPLANGKPWLAANNIGEVLGHLLAARAVASILAIENTVEGGVSAVLDALASTPDLRITAEYTVPVNFDVLSHEGTELKSVQTVLAHPVAYAQCSNWLTKHLPHHTFQEATSNMAAAHLVLASSDHGQVALVPTKDKTDAGVVLARRVGNSHQAVTRFVLVSKKGSLAPPLMTGHDKTTVVVDLAADRPGALLELLEQFATRSVNLSLIHSRPIGDGLGRYRFFLDLEGHVSEPRVVDALLGIKRVSPRVLFLGSYPMVNSTTVAVPASANEQNYAAARDWLKNL